MPKTLFQYVEDLVFEVKSLREAQNKNTQCLTELKESMAELLEGLDHLKTLSGCSEDWEEQDESAEECDSDDNDDMQVEPSICPRKPFPQKRSKSSPGPLENCTPQPAVSSVKPSAATPFGQSTQPTPPSNR